MVGRQHARHRPRRPTTGPARRRAGLAAGPRTQKRLYDGGFAGICFPREYGGLGLDYEYQKAFDAETLDYEMPLILNTPTFTICCATLLDTGSEPEEAAHRRGAARR